ncbi:ATP-binding protein [Streptomyces sp. NPDC051940]|uniref:ATP-binding protein n=1 Tax=Streptomyces sp. NPDC051940 TaxID=3155675 RepID=UPI00342C2B04
MRDGLSGEQSGAFAACALAATERAVPEIRAFAATVLAAWGADEDTSFAARTIVTELVGNAVRHSGSPHVELKLSRAADEVRIEVADAGAWRPGRDGGERLDGGERPDRPGVPGCPAVTADIAEEGRGLLLVHHFAARCGIIRSAVGTRAWAHLPPQPAIRLAADPGP